MVARPNKAGQRLPENWPEIRASILARSEVHGTPCCEMVAGGLRCEAPDRNDIVRVGVGYRWVRALAKGPGTTPVVLTIAHLDQDRSNNDPYNLAALCQRCHLGFDATWRSTPEPTVQTVLEAWSAKCCVSPQPGAYSGLPWPSKLDAAPSHFGLAALCVSIGWPVACAQPSRLATDVRLCRALIVEARRRRTAITTLRFLYELESIAAYRNS